MGVFTSPTASPGGGIASRTLSVGEFLSRRKERLAKQLNIKSNEELLPTSPNSVFSGSPIKIRPGTVGNQS